MIIIPLDMYQGMVKEPGIAKTSIQDEEGRQLLHLFQVLHPEETHQPCLSMELTVPVPAGRTEVLTLPPLNRGEIRVL
jgi:hypothetical protein